MFAGPKLESSVSQNYALTEFYIWRSMVNIIVCSEVLVPSELTLKWYCNVASSTYINSCLSIRLLAQFQVNNCQMRKILCFLNYI
nr:hypothetical protein CFP56_69914 [Quercus suber]